MEKAFFFRIDSDLFTFIVFLLVSSGLLVFSGGELIVSFRDVGFSVTSRVEKAAASVSFFVTHTVKTLKTLSEVQRRYEVLREQLKDYEFLQGSRESLRKENQRLRAMLGFSRELSTRNIPAEIIGFDPDNLYSGIVVSRGARHGVRKNMPVVAFQSDTLGLVGKVVQVSRTASMIVPLYHYQFYVAGKLERAQYRGLISGQGGSDFPLLMRYVKKHGQGSIRVGDLVVTSGENYPFPKDVPVGKVRDIKLHDHETSLELSLDPVLDLFRLEYVFILDLSLSQEGPHG